MGENLKMGGGGGGGGVDDGFGLAGNWQSMQRSQGMLRVER